MTVSAGLTTNQHISDAAGLELTERNIALWAGLRTAIDEHRAHPMTYRLKHELFQALENEVCALSGLRRLGEASRRSGIVAVLSSRVPVGELYAGLAKRGIRAWVGLGEHTPLFAPGKGADEFLRLSVGPDVTRSSVDKVVQAMTDLVGHSDS
jgi:selenocysteine lyase/cysteine desulfurase